jgi:hypothetical protein
MLKMWMAGPLRGAVGFPATATTDVEDVDGGPLGVLAADPAATTIDIEDVDGGSPGGCCRDFRQQPSPMLKTSMAGPWGC